VTVARILIAEDEDAIRSLIARALRQDGHEVVTAIDGARALDVLAREKGAFELLLTDIRMPVMDGIALAHAAARNHPDVTIVLMTGYADQRERAHGLDALIHDVITKVLARGDAPRGQRRALRATAAEALAARWDDGCVLCLLPFDSNQGRSQRGRNSRQQGGTPVRF